MPSLFSQSFQALPEHIDANGHVNNVVYLQWMQEIAYAHSVAQGFDAATLDRLGHSWVVRSHFVKYLRPVFAGDRIQAFTWVANWGRVSSVRRYKFLRPADAVAVATGETNWVYVDRASGRPVAIPSAVREAFQLLPADEEP